MLIKFRFNYTIEEKAPQQPQVIQIILASYLVLLFVSSMVVFFQKTLALIEFFLQITSILHSSKFRNAIFKIDFSITYVIISLFDLVSAKGIMGLFNNIGE